MGLSPLQNTQRRAGRLASQLSLNARRVQGSAEEHWSSRLGRAQASQRAAVGMRARRASKLQVNDPGSVQRAPIRILNPSNPQIPAGVDGAPAKAEQNCRDPPSRAPARRAPLVRPSSARRPGLLQVGGRRRGGRVRYGPDSHPAVEADHKVHLPRMVRRQVNTPKTERLSFCPSVCLLVTPPSSFSPLPSLPFLSWGGGLI